MKANHLPDLKWVPKENHPLDNTSKFYKGSFTIAVVDEVYCQLKRHFTRENSRVFNPAGTRRPEDVPLWFYFGRDVPDHNRTKLGRIRFLTYFGFAMSVLHLASGNIE